MDETLKCTKCKLHTNTKYIKLDSTYPEDTEIDIAFISDVPGFESEEKGIPLSGEAGKNLKEAMLAAKINPDKVFKGYLCKCRPNGGRKPNKDEIKTCYSYIVEELQQLKPKMIVCLGLPVAKAILQNKDIKMGTNHGKFFNGSPSLGYDCAITLTWNPSPTTFTHGPDRKEQMNTDIKRAYNHVTQQGKATEKTWTDIVVTDKVTWDKVFPIFNAAPILVWDVETTGLDGKANDAALTNVGLACDKRFGVSVVCDTTLWKSIEDYEYVMSGVDSLLSNPNIKKIAHNMRFDAKYYCAIRGIWMQNWWWDTMLAHALRTPGYSNKLKDIAYQYTEMGGYEYDLAAFGGLLCATPMERTEYNISDCICTLLIYEKQLNALTNTTQYSLFTNVTMPAAEALAEMEYFGVPVDIFEIQEQDRTMTKEMRVLKRQICTHPNALLFSKHVTLFNPGSHDHKRKLLFDKKYFGHPVIKYTKPVEEGGVPSTDKEVMLTLADGGSEFCQLLLEYSKVTKLHSTYVKGQQNKVMNERIYTSYNQAIARSGRLSSSNPNLQNIPKASNLKNIFVAEQGHSLLSADYCQMELAVSTYYTKDQGMINAILSGDAHTYIATRLFGISEDKIKEERTYVKTLNFGVIYGIGAAELGKKLKLSTADAMKLINEYFVMFKATKTWIDMIRKQAESEGYVTSLFDRRRYYPQSKRGELNSAVNHPVQSLASDLTLYAMVNWRKFLIKKGYHPTKARMILQVHDEICSSVSQDVLQELAFEKKRVLESTNFPFMTLPLTVDVNIGREWGNLRQVKI